MRFAIFDPEGKGAYLRQRLISDGHTPVERVDETDLLLVDCDWRWAHPRPAMIQAAKDAGATVVLYPHAGLPTCFVYDGLTEPDPNVSLRLEHGPGHLELGGGGLDQEPVGWLFSPTAPFQAVESPVRVLFAPMHPNIEALNAGTNGHDPAPSLNQELYRQLLGLGLELTVSLVASPHRNGVWPHPTATLVSNDRMQFQHSYQLIQQADVVVAHGTIAAAAVACGKPTVMFGEQDLGDYIDGSYQYATHADEMRSLVRYPLTWAPADDLAAVIALACAGTLETEAWRAKWVGSDGIKAALVVLKRLVGDVSFPVKTRDVTIEGATATVKITT